MFRGGLSQEDKMPAWIVPKIPEDFLAVAKPYYSKNPEKKRREMIEEHDVQQHRLVHEAVGVLLAVPVVGW